jgi:hypothetical protein
MAKGSLTLVALLMSVTFVSLIMSFRQTFFVLNRSSSYDAEQYSPPALSRQKQSSSSWDGSTPPIITRSRSTATSSTTSSSTTMSSSKKSSAKQQKRDSPHVLSNNSNKKIEKSDFADQKLASSSVENAALKHSTPEFTIDLMFEHKKENSAKKTEANVKTNVEQKVSLAKVQTHPSLVVTSAKKTEDNVKEGTEKKQIVKLPLEKIQTPPLLETTVVPPFTTQDISRLARIRKKFLLHLLLFDGYLWRLYSMSDSSSGYMGCPCTHHFIELLIDGLITARPKRFDTHHNDVPATFQVLLATVHDNVYYPCVKNQATNNSGCAHERYPPLLTFGSVPKNSSLTPFLYQFPTKLYNDCLYHHYRRVDLPVSSRDKSSRNAAANEACYVKRTVESFSKTDDVWNNNKTLVPQLFWRGSQLNFLKDMPEYAAMRNCQQVLPSAQAALWILQEDDIVPRCRAAALSLQAEAQVAMQRKTKKVKSSSSSRPASLLPWINVKFVENRAADSSTYYKKGAQYLLGNYTSPKQMQKYKYQIDLGGMGGTTWVGTITKLAMPGLLFHHETPTKDWFYDEIQPWIHYVPIRANLSNLHDMFVWAETHPEQARQIAKQGQEYARYLVTNSRFQDTFDRLYAQRLGLIADAYQPQEGETVRSILQQYRTDGLHTFELAACHGTTCKFKSLLNDYAAPKSSKKVDLMRQTLR